MDTLKPVYDNIIKTAMHTVTPENIANFLGKRFSLQFEGISSFDDPSDGIKKLSQAVDPVTVNNRKYKGFNFFSAADKELLLAVANPRFTADGMRNKHLREALDLTPAQISRQLKRLCTHKLIEKVHSTFKYRLTALVKNIISAGFKFINMFLIPKLASF